MFTTSVQKRVGGLSGEGCGSPGPPFKKTKDKATRDKNPEEEKVGRKTKGDQDEATQSVKSRQL